MTPVCAQIGTTQRLQTPEIEIMARKELRFSPKDKALRRDVGRLGALVGDLIREQCGEPMFELVETVRQASIRNREADNGALTDVPADLDAKSETDLIRAFSTYFQVVNLAERVHRIRRLREWSREADAPQPGGLESSLGTIATGVASAQQLQGMLDQLRIEPVFTAHPTEPTRRTILRKQQRVARRLVELMNPSLTPRETATAWDSIRAAITSAWQTEEHPTHRMTVSDEFEHVRFFLTDVIYQVVPVFYETLEAALDASFGDKAAEIRIPDILRFGSWVGGDMDGNPGVNAGTIRATLGAQRDSILRLYEAELRSVAERLTQCPTRVAVDTEVDERCKLYSSWYPNTLAHIAPRHRNMPYRVLCHLLVSRLRDTRLNGEHPYLEADEFLHDLQVIAVSLEHNLGRHAGLFAVRRLIWRVRTFGFHLAALDLRQDALVHRRVIGRGLGEPDGEQQSAEQRAARLAMLLDTDTPAPVDIDAEAERTLDVFKAVNECRRRFGNRAVGPYIISMAQSLDDVLSVLVLARWAGLSDEDGVVPLDVAPLFETLQDLEQSPQILDNMLADRVYAAHLERRQRRQMVMIGYSDSSKDAGIAASRWALQQAEASLARCARDHDIRLTLFHGRGGTVSRGGGKTHVAVMAAPPGAVKGTLRVTEQGEIINAKYGLRGIALRTLERGIGSVALASFGPEQPPPQPLWTGAMAMIATTSASAYRSLVHEDPDFYGFFRQATPIDVIEQMKIGSRPSSRRSGQGVADLRAIPWVFAWTQNRCVLPGWYGLGVGLEAASRRFGDELLSDMFANWLFMRALLTDVEMVLAKADMQVAARYAQLVDPGLRHYFDLIRDEFGRTMEIVLRLKGGGELLDQEPVLQRAIRLRNPYVDPLSMIQVDLLDRWRAGGSRDQGLLEALLLTVNGIAHGLQNTG
ncbi:MAG: phosphoenolpyruvate carboxylase [Gammaproteobacteria bacterium]